MAARGDRRRRRRWNPWKWLAALLSALTVHAAWFWLLDADWSVPTGTVRTRPALFVQTDRDTPPDTGHAIRQAVHTPTLFALPSAFGFSRRMREQNVLVRPPIRPPEFTDLQMTWNARDQDPSTRTLLPEWESLSQLRRTDLLVEAPGLRHTQSAAARRAVALPRISIPGAITEADHPIHTEWPEALGAADGPPVVREMLLRIGANGGVEQVVLEQALPQPAESDAWVRALYRWRWAPRETVAFIRVRIATGGPAETNGGAPNE